MATMKFDGLAMSNTSMNLHVMSRLYSVELQAVSVTAVPTLYP
jgi:hypothetical protein